MSTHPHAFGGEDAPDPVLSFHEAWGAAKDRDDYHKPHWNRAQRNYEGSEFPLRQWLIIVSAHIALHPSEML